MKKTYFDKITLGFAQSLMLGHRPENLPIILIGAGKAGTELTTSKFGLFESASPNFNTYYPDVKVSDLKPKDGDFVKPIFRALSEVIVHKRDNPIDFSMNNVLKASMSKLLAQTVYANHEALIGNELGVVSDLSWQDGYTTEDGIIVPAGINAEFKIDGKAYPNIARGITMEPPSIHSCSVTVQFAWEPSHPQMDRSEFFGKLGTYDDKKNLIKRNVTEVVNYHEISLVAHGADPFAQVLDKEGKIVNPEYADNVYSLSAQNKEKPKRYFFSYKDDITSLSVDDSTLKDSNNINIEPMKDLIAKLALKYKKPETDITESFIETLINDSETSLSTATTALETANGNVTRLTSELATANGSVTTLTAEKATLAGEKATANTELAIHKPISESYTTKLRTEVKRVYNLLKADKADAAKLMAFDTDLVPALELSLKEYNEELELKFPGICNDCNSHNVSRNSAIEGAGSAGKKNKTIAEINDEIRNEAKGSWAFQTKEVTN